MVQILDARGNPIKPQPALEEPQTSRLLHLQRLYEEHPAAGLTPPRLAAILRDAEHGDLVGQHDLFRDMEEKDGHILTEMSKRKSAVTGLDYEIQPPPDATAREKADAEWLAEVLETLDLETICFDALDGIGHGFSAQEIEWGSGKERLPVAIHHRPQSWFTTDLEDRNRLMLRDGSGFGAALNPFGWIVHAPRSKSGYLARGGLHRTLAWPYLFKNYSVRDLAEFLEIYGLPMRIGRYPSGSSPEEKATLLRAVMGIGHAAAGIIPQGMQIEFASAADGNKDPFEYMIEWCERTESKVILGQTTSSQADRGGSNYALGKVHEAVRQDITKSDAKQLARTLTRDLLWPIMAINKAGATFDRCPRLAFQVETPEDIKTFAEALPKLADAGMRIDIEWAHDKLRIPMAKDGAIVLASPKPMPQNPQEPTAALTSVAALSGQVVQEDSPARYADVAAERLSQDAAPAIKGWLDGIAALVASASSLEQLRDALLDAYSHLQQDELQNVLQIAFAAAELAGRHDVQEES